MAKRTFTIEENGSLTVKETDSKEKDITTYYEIPDQITNWQMQQLEVFIGDLLLSCTKSGELIVTSLLTIFNSGGTEEEMKEKLQNFGAKFLEQSGGFVGAMFGGFNDIFKFLGNGGNNRLCAIMFLERGETSIQEETAFKDRQAFFNDAPASLLWRGIKIFFGEKLGWSKNMDSLSKIFARMKSAGQSPEPSDTFQQTGSIDLSTSLSKEEKPSEELLST
jgi:hypothetical protein